MLRVFKKIRNDNSFTKSTLAESQLHISFFAEYVKTCFLSTAWRSVQLVVPVIYKSHSVCGNTKGFKNLS